MTVIVAQKVPDDHRSDLAMYLVVLKTLLVASSSSEHIFTAVSCFSFFAESRILIALACALDLLCLNIAFVLNQAFSYDLYHLEPPDS